MTPDEKKLAHGFRTEQAGSFEKLYDEYGPRIYRFCLRVCHNRADAEDLTQEVFLAAFKGLDRFDSRSSLATWLYRIALFRWRSIRNVKRPRTVSLDETSEPFSADPAHAGLDRLALEQALSALPDNLREAFLLVKQEQLLCREAAEILMIPEGTLKSRVHSAIVRLQKLLATDEAAAPFPKSATVRPTKETYNEL
jgi:RNA polymerase sigma-70 factor (ECF subfamily)